VRDGAFVDVAIAVGTTTIRALISRQSRDRLRLDHGSHVWALIKTVALDTRSVGFMRRPRGMMDVQ
jgi:molybdate transport system ATP-binding protein